MFLKLVHPEKHPQPSFLQELGITIDVKLIQFLKNLSGSPSIELGRLTETRLLHPAKAPAAVEGSPISCVVRFVIELGKSMCVKLLQFAKHTAPIFLTVLGIIMLVMCSLSLKHIS